MSEATKGLETSILRTIAGMFQIETDDELMAYQQDLMIHINSAISTLTQIGLGPEDGYEITGTDEKWIELTKGNKLYGMAKQFIYLDVALVFDIPENSFKVQAYKDKRDETLSRIQYEVNDERRNPKGDHDGI